MTQQTPNQNDIWAEDTLGRKGEVEYLSLYLSRRFSAKPNEAGFVLAINSDWGTGKSFMLTRWRDSLHNQGYPAIYFDAWKSDYTPQPLVAFIAELTEGLRPYFKKIPSGPRLQKSLTDKAKAALAPVGKALLYGAAKHALGITAENLHLLASPSEISSADLKSSDFLKDTGEAIGKAVDDALKEHTTTQKAIVAFKETLASLVGGIEKSRGLELPLYIFIDELDRCRPDYAIQLLEGVKHLFGVPGIYFIVATNMLQLSESVKVLYGSNFESKEYLRRFFDMEYILPEPDRYQFAAQLFKAAALPADVNFFSGRLPGFTKGADNKDWVPFIFERYSSLFGLTLRDQEHVMRLLEAVILGLHPRPIHIYFLFFLAMIYHKSTSFYRKVLHTRSLGDGKELNSLTRHASFGTIFIKAHRPESYYDNVVRYAETGPRELADLYFNLIHSTRSDMRDVNTLDFPRALLHDIYTYEGKRDDVEIYFEAIHRAGGFSSH